MTYDEIIAEAASAAKSAALAVWDRDEHQDRGSCGGAVLLLKKGRKFTKAAVAAGVAIQTNDSIFVGPSSPTRSRA